MALEKIKISLKITKDRYLHSREHVLADELSQKMGESKKFAAYLGLAHLYDEPDLRGLAKRVLQKKDLPYEARGKYFFAALRGLVKKEGVKFKNARRKRKQKINVKNKKYGRSKNHSKRTE